MSQPVNYCPLCKSPLGTENALKLASYISKADIIETELTQMRLDIEKYRYLKEKKDSMLDIKLYYHKTDNGAEYLTDKHIENGNEGIFEGSKYIVRIDGNIKKAANLIIK